MTVQQVIDKVQEEKPNSFSNAKIVSFINEIEAYVADRLQVYLPVYTTDTLSSELLVSEPYDNLYISYVKAMVDYANEEYTSYQLNQMQHEQDKFDFENWVVRTKQVQDDKSMPGRFSNVF